MKTKSVQILKP